MGLSLFPSHKNSENKPFSIYSQANEKFGVFFLTLIALYIILIKIIIALYILKFNLFFILKKIIF